MSARVARTASALLFTAVVGVAISMQGWRTRGLLGVEKDLVVPAQSAYELLHRGIVPDRGTISGSLAFTPPGTNWLFVPGVALFKDPRLYQVPISAMFFALTLVGLFLLGRLLAGAVGGWLAVLLYALSWIGLFFATSLWGRGHPVFVVWVLYLCVLAVHRGRQSLIVTALVLYGVGNYVFPEIAPLGIAIALAFILNRGLLRWRTALIAGSLILVVWAPYLRFQTSRGFRDVIVLATNRAPSLTQPVWWPRALVVREYSTGAQVDPATVDITWPPPQSYASSLQRFVSFAGPSVLSSFYWNVGAYRGYRDSSRIPALLSSLLVAFIIYGVLLLAAFAGWTDSARTRRIGLVTAGVVLVLAIVTNVTLVRSVLPPEALTPSGQQALLGVHRHLSLTLLWLLIILLVAGRYARDSRQPFPPAAAPARTAAVMVVSTFLAGQLFWSWLAGAESRRFMWLWPLQCLIIAYAATALTAERRTRMVRGVVAVALVLLVAKNDTLVQRLASWRRESWQGRDADVVKVLDALARDAAKKYRAAHVAVSYDLVLEAPWMKMGLLDSTYDNAMAYDLYLLRKHGLQNRVTAVDTFDESSDYLIAEEPRRPGGRHLYFERPVDLSRTYELVTKSGALSLYVRPPTPSAFDDRQPARSSR